MDTLLCIEISFSLFVVAALLGEEKYKIVGFVLMGRLHAMHTLSIQFVSLFYFELYFSRSVCVFITRRKKIFVFFSCCCCLAIVANCYEMNNLTLLLVLFYSSLFLFYVLNFNYLLWLHQMCVCVCVCFFVKFCFYFSFFQSFITSLVGLQMVLCCYVQLTISSTGAASSFLVAFKLFCYFFLFSSSLLSFTPSRCIVVYSSLSCCVHCFFLALNMLLLKRFTD